MTKPFVFLAPRCGRHAQHLAHQRIIVGHVFHPIPVRIQSQPHDPQDEDLPEVHAGTTSRLLTSENLRFNGATQRSLPWAKLHRPPIADQKPGWAATQSQYRSDQTNLFPIDVICRSTGLGPDKRIVENNRECCRFRRPNPNKGSIFTPTFAHSNPHQNQSQSTSRTLNARHYLGPAKTAQQLNSPHFTGVNNLAAIRHLLTHAHIPIKHAD